MKIALKDIKPNPHRNLAVYPLNQQKVQELVASINATEAGFWDNVLVRRVGDKYELAYGHHRLEAAKQAGLREADFIVKKLSDAEMLKIMTLENAGDLQRTKISMLLESVEAAVKAIAAGTIEVELAKDTRKDLLRYAPSFTAGEPSPGDGERPYTTQAIALVLGEAKKSGKTSDTLAAIVDALELVERRDGFDRVGGSKIPTHTQLEAIETLDELQYVVRVGKAEIEARERAAINQRREAEALAKAEARRKEAETRRQEAEAKNTAEQARRQEKIREEAKALRIAQEDQDREAAKKHREYISEQEKLAKERQKDFERKRAELDKQVEMRKQREEQKRADIEERSQQVVEPKIAVEEKPTVDAREVLRDLQRAVDALQSALEKSRAIKQDDPLTLKRIKTSAEEASRLSNRILVKFNKA